MAAAPAAVVPVTFDFGINATDVKRLTLGPDDALVIRFDVDRINREMAEEVQVRIRQMLGRPSLPVLVLARGDSVEVATLPHAT